MSIRNFCLAILKRPGMLLVLGAAVLAVLTAIYAVRRVVAISRANSNSMSASKQSSASYATQGSSLGVSRSGPVQVVRITLYDVGIIPQQSYAQPGLVTIAIEDLSGGTTGVIVERDDDGEAHTQAGQVRRKENNRHGNEALRLPAGHYRLYMADRPENRAELIVEP